MKQTFNIATVVFDTPFDQMSEEDKNFVIMCSTGIYTGSASSYQHQHDLAYGILGVAHAAFELNCEESNTFLFAGRSEHSIPRIEVKNNYISVLMYDNDKTKRRIKAIKKYWKDLVIPSTVKIDKDYLVTGAYIRKVTFAMTQDDDVELF